MIKTFALDTNIILSFPHALLDDFDDNNIVITETVLKELDKKKSADGEVGYNAREAARILERLSEKGDLSKGVQRDIGGTVAVFTGAVIGGDEPDERIINECRFLEEERKDARLYDKKESNRPYLKKSEGPVVLITSDTLMRVRAKLAGVECQEFKKIQVVESKYSGHIEYETDDWSLLEELYEKKTIESPIVDGMYENEFVTFRSGSKAVPSVFREGRLDLIPEQRAFGWVHPKNIMQTYAMWALSQPAETLPLVILEGPAGSAKTFLSVAEGLDATYTAQKKAQRKYRNMFIVRPVANAFNGDQGMGFLPGSLEEKLDELYQNYFDNIRILLRGADGEKDEAVSQQLEYLMEEEIIDVGALSMIRGRSMISTYLILDEAQNSTKTQIRDVITRAGVGTKVVLAGDPGQIDAAHLSKTQNGLVSAAAMMRGSKLSAYLKFGSADSFRSPLAKDAIERMVW